MCENCHFLKRQIKAEKTVQKIFSQLDVLDTKEQSVRVKKLLSALKNVA